MPLVASYVVGSNGYNANTLTTPAFTPASGEVIVVKMGNQDDDDPALTGVSGGGLNWRNTAEWRQGSGNFSDAWIYTATVGASPQQMAVSSTWTAAVEEAGWHGMIVERWTGVVVPTNPAVNGIRTGSGAPSATLTGAGYGSPLTWACVDWNAVAGVPVARGTDGAIVAEYSPGGSYFQPSVAGRATGGQTLDSTQHPITLPSGVTAGEMLVVLFSSDGSSPVSVPPDSEWALVGTSTAGTAHSSTLLWKIADGTDSLTVLTDAAEQSTHVSMRVLNGATIEAASAQGSGGTGGTTTTTTTTATITGRTTGIAETAATSHTVTLPAGVAAGEAALVLFANDTATSTASTASSGWAQLDTQQQGTTTNHRGTLFYAANAAAAAALVVTLSAAEEASWASFRIAGGGTPVFNPVINTTTGVAGGSGTSITPAPLTGLAAGDYTALLLLAVDSSTDTALSQAVTWPAGWVNPQTRRPAVAGTSTSPEVFTAEQRFTGVTAGGSITPGGATLSLTEQWLEWTVAIPDGSTTTTTGGNPLWNVPPALTPTLGGTTTRLWISSLALDTSAATGSAQALTVPGGFGSLTRSNGTGNATALTATAETISNATSLQPPPWVHTTADDWACWTIAITGAFTSGGGNLRLFAGTNYDPDSAPGARTFGMTAPTGQAWTLIGIELYAAPVTVTLGVVEDVLEVPAITAGRAFTLGVAESVDEVPAITATRLVAGPYLGVVEEVAELPDLTVYKQLPALGAAEMVDEVPPLAVHRLVELGAPPEEVQEVPPLSWGSTGLGVAVVVEDVPPLTVGSGGIDIARSRARRGLPPVIYRGGTRVMAQNILTGEWLHPELPVSDLRLTRTLSGPQVIAGVFDYEISDLRDVGLMPWGTWLHVEEAGEIRASGILLPGSYDPDGKLELTAHGVSAYAARIPYTGEFRAIRMDPAEIVRTLWQHVQSFSRGDLGVSVIGSTPVRLGQPETEEVRDETVGEKKEAAQAIIDALANPTIHVYDDWTWPGCPDSVQRWNGSFIAAFNAQYSGAAATAPVADGNITRATYKEMALEVGGSLAWATSGGAAGGGYDWTADYAAVSAQGARGYVGGVCGFSTATGSMLAVVQAYTALTPGNGLAGYVDELTTLAREGPGTTADARADALLGSAFRTAWAAAATTVDMRKAQRQERDRQFFNPALAQAQADGVGPLGLVVHYAMMLTFGSGTSGAQYGGMLTAARAVASPPSKGGDETTYLRTVLAQRPAAPAAATPSTNTSAAVDASTGVGTDEPEIPPDEAAGADEEERINYVVGAVKIPHDDRDVAHAVITTADDRGFYDIIGADTPDDHDEFPVGSDVTYRVALTRAEAARFREASNARYVAPDTVGRDDAVAIPAAATLAFMRADLPEAATTYHGRDVIVGLLDGGTTAAVRSALDVTMLAKQTFGPDAPGADEITSTHGCLVAPCLLPQGGKFLDAIVSTNDGLRYASDTAAAARWCVDNGAQVLNYSGSGASANPVWDDLFTYLGPRGVQFYASMGNDGLNRANYPAALSTKYPRTVHSSISFDKTTGRRSTFSNYTATADGCAPGTSELGLTPAGATTTWSGTSASAPHMARLNAMGATAGRFSAAEVGAALKANTRDLAQPVTEQGGGAYDLTAALTALGAFTVAALLELVGTGNLTLATPVRWTARAYSFNLAAPPADRETTGGAGAVAGGAKSTDQAVVTTWLTDNVLSLNEVVTPAGEPWQLHGYELAMVGRVIQDLGEETPFEYVEEQGWTDATKSAVYHRIRIGYPRVGSRLDLNLTQGENLLEHAPFEEPDAAYADSAFVQGKGEGADAIAGYAGVDVPSRLRLPKVVTDKRIASTTLATARAHEEVAAALASVEEIAEIAVNTRHENSLYGTFDVGDEVLPRVRLPWLGAFAQWHRITQITYAPEDGYATCTLSRRDAFRSR